MVRCASDASCFSSLQGWSVGEVGDLFSVCKAPQGHKGPLFIKRRVNNVGGGRLAARVGAVKQQGGCKCCCEGELP